MTIQIESLTSPSSASHWVFIICALLLGIFVALIYRLVAQHRQDTSLQDERECLQYLVEHLLTSNLDRVFVYPPAVAPECLIGEPNAKVYDSKTSYEDYKFVRKLDCFLRDNHGKAEITRHDAAEHFNISEKTLHRKMLPLYDASFVDVLRAYRINKARFLIAHGLPISNVAHDVGFGDISTFNRCFKQQTGMRPSDAKA